MYSINIKEKTSVFKNQNSIMMFALIISVFFLLVLFLNKEDKATQISNVTIENAISNSAGSTALKCGTCQANGALVKCNKATQTYYCTTTPTGPCETSCI